MRGASTAKAEPRARKQSRITRRKVPRVLHMSDYLATNLITIAHSRNSVTEAVLRKHAAPRNCTHVSVLKLETVEQSGARLERKGQPTADAALLLGEDQHGTVFHEIRAIALGQQVLHVEESLNAG